MVRYIENPEYIKEEELIEIYSSVEWTNYTKNITSLTKAISNSSYVICAYFDTELVGLARSISDDVSIHYLQDILVKPSWQKQGIGKKLISYALKRYNHVRTNLLLTDNEKSQLLFYTSVGFNNTKDLNGSNKLNVFIKH